MTTQQNQQDEKNKKTKPQQSDQGQGQGQGGKKQFHSPEYHPKPGHGGPDDPNGADEGSYGT